MPSPTEATFVQAGQAVGNSFSFPSNVALGNSLIVCCTWDTTGGAFTGISDTRGNHYELIADMDDTVSTQRDKFFYVSSALAGATTVTMTGPTAYNTIVGVEFSGLTAARIMSRASTTGGSAAGGSDGAKSAPCQPPYDRMAIIAMIEHHADPTAIAPGTGYTEDLEKAVSPSTQIEHQNLASKVEQKQGTWTVTSPGGFNAAVFALVRPDPPTTDLSAFPKAAVRPLARAA